MTNEYDKSLACIDRVEKAIGGDPALNVMRASIRIEQKKFDEARALCEKALAEEPDLFSGHWVLVTIALAEKKFQETADRLSEIETLFEVEFTEIEKEPIYAEFIKSPEYQRWLERRKKALKRLQLTSNTSESVPLAPAQYCPGIMPFVGVWMVSVGVVGE